MTDHNFQSVEAFMDKIEQDPEAKARFESLAKEGNVAGFEQWAEESGCSPDVLAALLASQEKPEGELSDADLDGVAGGAITTRWFARSASIGSSVMSTPQVDQLSTRINAAWARWQKISFTRPVR